MVIGDEEKSELKSLLVLSAPSVIFVVVVETFVGFFFLRFFACCSGDVFTLSLDLDEVRFIGDIGLQTVSLEDVLVKSIVP